MRDYEEGGERQRGPWVFGGATTRGGRDYKSKKKKTTRGRGEKIIKLTEREKGVVTTKVPASQSRESLLSGGNEL